MKKHFNILFLVICAIGFASCQNDEDTTTYAQFEGTIPQIAGFGGSVTIKVKSDTQWTISKSENGDWFHITPYTSKEDEEITLKVDATQEGQTREGWLYLSTFEGKSDSIHFAQGPLQIPEAASAIQGKDFAQMGESITLSVDSLPNAQTYRWYRNGELYSETNTRQLEILLPGKYTAAGYNSLGEGEKSPEKEITFGTNVVFDNIEKAEYIGSAANQNSYSYRIIMTKRVNELTEVGMELIITDVKPKDADHASLTSGTYRVCDPYENDFKFEGRVEGNNEYSLTPWSGEPYGTYIFIRKNGTIIPQSVTYLHKDPNMTMTVTNNNGHYSIKGSDLDCFNAIIKISVNEWGSTNREIVSQEERGLYSMAFEGDITFKNNGSDYMTYNFNSDEFKENYSNLKCDHIYLQYDPDNPNLWHFGLGENAGISGSGWEVSGDFYPLSDSDPTGVYLVANVVGKKIRGTVDRGWSRYNSVGTGLTAVYWEGLTRKDIVFGQPARNSYLKIEKTDVSQYRISLLMVDASGKTLTLRGEKIIEPVAIDKSR